MERDLYFGRVSLCVFIVVFMGWMIMGQAAMAGNGFMGGRGTITVEEEPEPDVDADGSIPDDVDGPLNDEMSNQGKLFGDLFKILRYTGGEIKLVPEVNVSGQPVCRDANGEETDCESPGAIQEFVLGSNPAVGGEPVLSEDYAQYAREVAENVYELATAAYPSQCVQPVADLTRWDPVDGGTGLPDNRLPLVMTYDATWKRTECEVCELKGELSINETTGEITTQDCLSADDTDCYNRYYKWPDESCPEGILWTDLVDEVHFGRLNLSRSPEAVLQAAFDEAINSINSEDTIEISRDAAGRLLLTKNVYNETILDECGNPIYFGLVDKAIDSPLENLALYVKLMKDGHLVTPGDERAPIDRSDRGGIPLWKMLELSDGPSDALRPTVDISKLSTVFPALTVTQAKIYYTYYECYDAAGAPTPCLCEEISHDGTIAMVACSEVVTRELLAVETCPEGSANADATCQGPFEGLMTNDGGVPFGADFDWAAAFLAAAADKTGEIGADMVVYVNSILGINKVVGYSAYNEDGTPSSDAVDYSMNPEYFNYESMALYDRSFTIKTRGPDGYDKVTVLTDSSGGAWTETPVSMLDNITFRNKTTPGNIVVPYDSGSPNVGASTTDIMGFSQMADDNLSIIEFIHRYQIPGSR